MTPRRVHRRRHEIPGGLRFLTFSCYHRLQLFSNPKIRDAFAAALGEVQRTQAFRLFAWVVMPEHVHLLVIPNLPEFPVSELLRELKRPFAEAVIDRWRALNARILPRLTDTRGDVHFWQRGGGYDRNIWSDEEFLEKRTYIHHYPVARGLVARPEDWAWSSARWFAGDQSGPVRVERRWG